MSNALDDDKQQQLRAPGRLGWTLSRIQEATGIRGIAGSHPRVATLSMSSTNGFGQPSVEAVDEGIFDLLAATNEFEPP
jgi:hypothetical protein